MACTGIIADPDRRSRQNLWPWEAQLNVTWTQKQREERNPRNSAYARSSFSTWGTRALGAPEKGVEGKVKTLL